LQILSSTIGLPRDDFHAAVFGQRAMPKRPARRSDFEMLGKLEAFGR
jgi:hypothetical protein